MENCPASETDPFPTRTYTYVCVCAYVSFTLDPCGQAGAGAGTATGLMSERYHLLMSCQTGLPHSPGLSDLSLDDTGV